MRLVSEDRNLEFSRVVFVTKRQRSFRPQVRYFESYDGLKNFLERRRFDFSYCSLEYFFGYKVVFSSMDFSETSSSAHEAFCYRNLVVGDGVKLVPFVEVINNV